MAELAESPGNDGVRYMGDEEYQRKRAAWERKCEAEYQEWLKNGAVGSFGSPFVPDGSVGGLPKRSVVVSRHEGIAIFSGGGEQLVARALDEVRHLPEVRAALGE